MSHTKPQGSPSRPIRVRQRLGKYRIERRLGDGGFAVVFQAIDTIEGVRVALKIPHQPLVTASVLEDFRHEVRLAARLIHPNILPLKNAEFIDGHFVMAMPLGERTLADRLHRRMALTPALDFADQMLLAVAHAHERRIIHCDIKPENLILFPDGRLMLSDFGIARVALHTIRASGSGTIGYVAPEQAMGKPSRRSDVFSLGLVLYRMFAGQLPEWPFEWPPAGYERIRHRLHPELIALVRRSMAVDPRKRFKDAGQMLAALKRLRPRAVRHRRGNGRRPMAGRPARDWKTIRYRQFQKQFRGVLETRFRCGRCEGPVSEAMSVCPWCGRSRAVVPDETAFPQQCPRCHRGLKSDWTYCAWCFGAGFDVPTRRHYSDRRYTAKCANRACPRRLLMPFMRYCPWCHRKVKRKWPIPGSGHRCPSCGWGVVTDYWNHCAWCGTVLRGSAGK